MSDWKWEYELTSLRFLADLRPVFDEGWPCEAARCADVLEADRPVERCAAMSVASRRFSAVRIFDYVAGRSFVFALSAQGTRR